MKNYFFLLVFLISTTALAQKKPLDHTVYDSWKSIAERLISNDGAYIVYTVNAQEGDGELVIQNPTTKYKKMIPRGYNATITEDSKYLLCKIKPPFKDTRQAKIKKKKADDMPKDSFAIIQLGQDSITKIARLKSYKVPEKGSHYIAYHLEKALPDTAKRKTIIDSFTIKKDALVDMADSLIKLAIDSIKGNISKEKLADIINKTTNQILKVKSDNADADNDDASSNGNAIEGTDLVVKNIVNNTSTTYKLVSEYYFDKSGNQLLIETTKKVKDSTSKALLLLVHLQTNTIDTILKRFNEGKNYVFNEEGNKIAFVAERDSSEKALQKFYKLYYYTQGQDTATIIVDKNTVGMPISYTVSEHAIIEFSKDGSKLFFANAPIRSPKDTTLVDFELATVDVWHYKDDYLQPQQLKNYSTDLKKSYTAVYFTNSHAVVQLGADDAEKITLVNEGNANWVLGETTKGNRVEAQWTGRAKSTAYIINALNGERKLIFKNALLNATPSPEGKYVYWYNATEKNYFTYEVATGIITNISATIKVPLHDEENDVPDLPNEYGVMGWHQGDSCIYVYDQFDVWKIDPLNKILPTNLNLPFGREKKCVARYLPLDKKERYISSTNLKAFKIFNKLTKINFYYCTKLNNDQFTTYKIIADSQNCSGLQIAKNALNYFFTKESYKNSINLFAAKWLPTTVDTPAGKPIQLSDINPQQNEYNWGTAELFTWKTYTGKMSEGIVYKPEDFNPKKKYPMICYFYEKLSETLYNYQSPAPTPSRLNIPFFVSRGYIVFVPNIEYTTGHPGNDAYNYIVSGARSIVKLGYVDSTKIGIQGQSWGGYQVAYLITKTKLFAAAWAGAPVANMTSAYGGIRWESGLNRQFQYEKQQSRIGATLWDKPQLYIENSPLFHLPNVQTPLAIMHNDADGAVPWYQGIELFTGLRRLGKPVWLLNYNGEAHNLLERRNRKDIQIREQQFFDWLLKGEKPTKWITDGVPAIDKGKDWGTKVGG